MLWSSVVAAGDVQASGAVGLAADREELDRLRRACGEREVVGRARVRAVSATTPQDAAAAYSISVQYDYEAVSLLYSIRVRLSEGESRLSLVLQPDSIRARISEGTRAEHAQGAYK